MELLIDEVLRDRYRIQSLLGRQTGRRTFLAQDLQTQQQVVLKLLLFGPDFTWDDLKLFEREAEVLKSLDLPTLPKYLNCFDIDTELGKGFMLVQTYIEAKSLQNWLDAGRTFNEADLISISRQLLAILDYLHNRQPAIIHRDIKPSNILLGDRSGNSPGQVYLVDFGSVKTVATGSTITVVGTYGYMPPEQFGGQATPASDLYALGATIICLATGQHPSELPHTDMRIDFVDRVNLSLGLTNWLKKIVEPSLDSRLKSTTETLLALNSPSIQARRAALSIRPFGSKIRLKNMGDILEVVIPPRGFHSRTKSGINNLITSIAIAVMYVGPCLMIVFTFARLFSSIPTAQFNLFCLRSFFATAIIITISIIWDLVFELAGTRRLQITKSKISLSLALIGVRCFCSNAPRQQLTKVELTLSKPTNNPIGLGILNPPQLNIWAGAKQFCISANCDLTELEQEWLVNQLTDWLDLPVRGV
jgi:serine/threonine protein kinase